MGDDRPKRSWKEIDAGRDKKRSGGRRDESERNRERASKTAAYSTYKSHLDTLFTPGGAQLPEHMREKLGPQNEDTKRVRELTEALTKNPGPETLQAVIDAEVELPDDPRLLMGLLSMRDEPLLRVVLTRLLAIIEGGKRPNRMLLIQRLESVKNFAEQSETLELIDMTRAALD